MYCHLVCAAQRGPYHWVGSTRTPPPLVLQGTPPQLRTPLLAAGFEAAATADPADPWYDQLLRQLHHSRLLHEADGGLLPPGLGPVVERARENWCALRVLGVPHACEQLTADGMLSIDIAIPAPEGGPGIALEVDGPSHYTVNTRLHMGAELARDWLLRARGYAVVSVAGHEWWRLRWEGKQQLLRDLLAEAGYCF